MGYLIKETGWSYQQIAETPAGIIEDILIYFNAYNTEENNRMNDASSNRSTNKDVVVASGINPTTDYKGYKIQDGVRRVPPPPNL